MNLNFCRKTASRRVTAARLGAACSVSLLWAGMGATPRALAQTLPAFPGAQGFGAAATGGRGGTVYHVTNLSDSGVGSFRDAVSKSNVTVVFDVGGQIVLNNRVTISGSNVTIAGQSAPGGGIGVMGAGVFVGGDNIIVRNMRFREGRLRSGADDSLDINATASTVIIDHCSVAFGEDENLTNYGSNTTVQWTSVAFGLKDHSAGGLTQGTNHSYHHNLYAHNHTRNIKNNSGLMDFTNNIAYNYGFAFIAADSTGGSYNVNFRGNYYSRPENGSRSLLVEQGAVNSAGVPTVNLFLGQNITDANEDGVWNGSDRGKASVSGSYTYVNAPFNVPAVTLDAPATAYSRVVASVGAIKPQRDEVDQALLWQVVNQKGDQVSSQNQVRDANGALISNDGYGTIAAGTAPLDSDADGLPDAWEDLYGLNKTNAADRNGDIDGTGYTNLEKYLNSLMDGAYPVPAFPAPWKHLDVGAVGVKGTAHALQGTFTDNGGGSDIGGTSDSFHFIYQPLQGDVSIVARVTELQNTATSAKAGVMIRENLGASAKAVTMVLRPAARGSLFLRRTTTGGNASFVAGSGVGEPYWLRLVRQGSLFTASQSPDGTTWTTVGTATIDMAQAVEVGLAVCGAVNTILNTSSFDNVAASGEAPPSNLKSAKITEFRFGGPGGGTDEFVEIYNSSSAPLDLNGYTLVAGTVITIIPGGKIIPPRGHLLLVGAAYSLADYGGVGKGAGDAMLAGDLPERAKISLLNLAGEVVDEVSVGG